MKVCKVYSEKRPEFLIFNLIVQLFERVWPLNSNSNHIVSHSVQVGAQLYDFVNYYL